MSACRAVSRQQRQHEQQSTTRDAQHRKTNSGTRHTLPMIHVQVCIALPGMSGVAFFCERVLNKHLTAAPPP